MNIGIIGAGLSGLTAGRILTAAGHDVVVYEKSAGYGGRMSTRRTAGPKVHKMDHGAPYITGTSGEFRAFIRELEDKKVIRRWTDTVSCFTDGRILPQMPGSEPRQLYIAPDGMNSIGKYLGRWMDICQAEKISGITHIGGSRVSKGPWMINSASLNVFEADAVIIATPAIQAYGLISTSQDEFNLRKMIALLDDLSYTSTFSFMACYGERVPLDWKALVCNHPVISWICSESSKRDTSGEVNLVVHSTDPFAKEMADEHHRDEVNKRILKALGEILGSWAARPEWHQSHFWRYHLPKKSLDMPFLESDDEYAPIALTGDYFQGRSMEAAYLSGLHLGRHWAEKLS